MRALGFLARALELFGQFLVMLDLLLDARDFRADAIHLGLHLVERFGARRMFLAAGFELGLAMTLPGNLLFDREVGLAQFGGMSGDRRLRGTQAERLQLGLFLLLFVLVALPALRCARLPFQVFELLFDFVAHVAHAVEILARRLDAAFGFLAALLVLGDAGGFLEMIAQLLGIGFDELADHALLDDRITARTKAGAEENIGDVAATAAHAVQEILRLSVATDDALDRDLVVARVFADDEAIGIVENELDHRAADGLASRRSGEDHVGQRIAAQAARRAFAHDPADRVDDVRLAATVRADDARHVGRQMQRGRIDERLEAGQFDRGQAHGNESLGCSAHAGIGRE